MIVPLRRTVVDLRALTRAIVRAWPECEDVDVAILFGKLVAECGWPNADQACWCWNVGNIRGANPHNGAYAVLAGAWECARPDQLPKGAIRADAPGRKCPPGEVAYLPGNPGESQRFRAFDCLDDAIADYLATLERTFRRAWAELQAQRSTPAAFVHAMKAGGYFRGDVSVYVRNTESGFAHALPRIPALRAELAAELAAARAAELAAAEAARPPTREHLADLSTLGPATPLRAGEAEHTPKSDPPPSF